MPSVSITRSQFPWVRECMPPTFACHCTDGAADGPTWRAQLQAESDASQLALAQLQGHLAEREAELSVLHDGQEELQNALQQSKAAAQKVCCCLGARRRVQLPAVCWQRWHHFEAGLAGKERFLACIMIAALHVVEVSRVVTQRCPAGMQMADLERALSAREAELNSLQQGERELHQQLAESREVASKVGGCV